MFTVWVVLLCTLPCFCCLVFSLLFFISGVPIRKVKSLEILKKDKMAIRAKLWKEELLGLSLYTVSAIMLCCFLHVIQSHIEGIVISTPVAKVAVPFLFAKIN